jgi:hypothetical protein
VSDDLAAILTRTIDSLRAAGIEPEHLAQRRPSRRVGPVQLAEKLVPAGRAWRLGEVLVTETGQLHGTGVVTRSLEPRQFAANKSPAEEARRDLQRAAVRGRFPLGAAVNVDYREIETTVDAAGELTVELADAVVGLEAYLADRVRFAITPGWD